MCIRAIKNRAVFLVFAKTADKVGRQNLFIECCIADNTLVSSYKAAVESGLHLRYHRHYRAQSILCLIPILSKWSLTHVVARGLVPSGGTRGFGNSHALLLKLLVILNSLP